MTGKTDEKRRIERHIANLDSPDEKVSARAEGYLIRHYGSRALEPLLAVCDHTNPTVRLRAAWVLGHTKDLRAYETILRLTDDPDERVRYDATIALGILGDRRASDPLTRMYLRNDPTRPAGMAFDRMGVQFVPVLIEILREGVPEVRWSVLQVLGGFAEKFGDERSIQTLEEARNDRDTEVRENAEFWLEEIRKVQP